MPTQPAAATARAMAAAVNRLITVDGGIVVAEDESSTDALPLPLGGLMCDQEPREGGYTESS
ncbi:adenine deaminase C-terminal domain-containing protein [Nitrospira sp. Kam-Ns4a]